MPLWPFFGCFTALLVILSLWVPVPPRVPLSRRLDIVPWKSDRCFALSYVTRERFDGPTLLRLIVPSVASLTTKPWAFSATSTTEPGWKAFDSWRPADGDSVDVFGYHTRVIRMPAQKDTGVGHVLDYPMGYSSLAVAMLSPAPHDHALFRRIPCDPDSTRR